MLRNINVTLSQTCNLIRMYHVKHTNQKKKKKRERKEKEKMRHYKSVVYNLDDLFEKCRKILSEASDLHELYNSCILRLLNFGDICG